MQFFGDACATRQQTRRWTRRWTGHGCVKRSDVPWDFGVRYRRAQRRNVHSDRFIARQRPPAIVWFIAPGNGIVGDDFIRHFATLASFFSAFLSPFICTRPLVRFFLLFLFLRCNQMHTGVARAARIIRATRDPPIRKSRVGPKQRG